MRTIHKKIWKQSFDKILSGEKKFELRLADFDVDPGDTLVLEEWDKDHNTYTGKKIEVTVTYVFKTKEQPFWPREEAERYGFQILSIEPKKPMV